jgi:uncharacterized HAD superfamily protein
MKICIDMDGVICEEIKPYSKAKPIKKNIKKIEKLFSDNKIIIWTSRRKSDRVITLKWLRDNQVPFDELIMKKPKFDIYVDEKHKVQGW